MLAWGEVTAFDEHAGLGVVRSATGGELPFHCVAITGERRTVAVGTVVRFRVVAALPGRWEAFDVDPVDPVAP